MVMKTKSSLKNLSKLELLELLAEQEREIRNLKQQLEQKDAILQERTLCMEHAGNIAQAALRLNGVFEAAQKAAEQYVESVKEMVDKNLEKTGMLPDSVRELQKPNAIKMQTATVEEVLQSLNAYKGFQDAVEKVSYENPSPSKQEDKE